jgi:hypothetical protein
MDGKYLALMVMASCAAGAVIVHVIADAVIKYLKLKKDSGIGGREREFDDRLRRIETAIDAVSIEVERIGEQNRFAAQLALGRAPAEVIPAELQLSPPTPTGRVITPH